MQHSALRQRVHFATMRHPAEEPESSASSRSPNSSNGSDSHRTVRAVFCFSAATSPPLVAFADASQQLSSAPPLPPLSRHSPTAHSAEAPSLALTTNAQQPRTTPHRRPHREAYTKRGQKMGALGKKRPTYSRFPATISSKSPSTAQYTPIPPTICPPRGVLEGENAIHLTFFAFRFASLPIPPYLCGNTCPQNFAPSVVKWPWLGFFSSPCCRNWW